MVRCYRMLLAVLALVWVVQPSTGYAQAAPKALAIVKPVTSCASLGALDLTAIGGVGSRVTQASETTSDGINVCSVTGMLAPQVKFQVLLPTETWTQRYLQVGCGGLCGSITLRSGASDGCKVFNDGGFVMAATDMGHSGGMADDGSWGLNTAQRVDFAYRAQHVTAQAAKALIRAFYGQVQRYTYFNGCSDGGREALMEAMRYPQDFDGVIAGAPAMLFQVQNTLFHAWQAVSNTGADGKIILTTDRLPILHKAVVAACDSLDGVTDGLIANPAACRFDVATITCKAGASDTANCLTPGEADVVRRFYDGPRDPATGAHLTAGQPLYGSELNWSGVYVADGTDGRMMSPMAALPVIRYLAFPQARPEMTLRDFPFTEATLAQLRARHGLFDATNADLSAFQAAGGKLILWHGLADPHIPPANTVALHKAMVAQMGQRIVEDFERLYLLPGVSHCGNGEGASNLDLLTPIMAWVENGQGPDEVITRSASEGSNFGAPAFGGEERPVGAPKETPRALPAMTRPIYPYPSVARYGGHGDVYDVANWSKGEAEETVTVRDWPGSDLFGRYAFSRQ